MKNAKTHKKIGMKTKIPQGNWSQEIKEMETVPNVFIHSNV